MSGRPRRGAVYFGGMPSPHLLFLGTGTAFNDDGRLSAGLLVDRGAHASFLVDVGPTVLVGLARAGRDPAAIDRLFVTHLHGDHTAGWPFLLLHLVFRGRRTEPFHVHGPPGTRETLERLVRSCYREVDERRAFDIVYDEIEVAEFTDHDGGPGVRFGGVPVDHHPTSLAYRFDLAVGPTTTRIAVTGDTRWCAGLEAIAAGADLLVTECTGIERGAQAHLSLDEIRASRARLGARRIVLVHLTDAVAERLALDPVPGVVAAHDGLILDLPVPGSEGD